MGHIGTGGAIALNSACKLAGEPMADLLGPLWRVVLVVVKIAGGEAQFGCEVEAGHLPVPTDLQGGGVEANEHAALIDTVGSNGRRDASESPILQPVVRAGLGDEDRQRAHTLAQSDDTHQPILI